MRLLKLFSLFCFLQLNGITQEQQIRITQFQNTLQANPSNADAHFGLGDFLSQLDNREWDSSALHHLKKAIELQPHNSRWLVAYAIFCCRIGHMSESINTYKVLLRRNPYLFQVLYNAGFAFKTAGDAARALAIYKAILKRKPDYQAAHMGLAFAHLALGEYQLGWQAHIWNLRHQKKYSPEFHSFVQNNQLTGKRILLTPEGGLGDTIHFIRYAQKIKQLGGYVIVAAQKPLLRILALCPYIDILTTSQQPIPAHDARVTLMSLPAHFCEDEEHLPQNIPYIFPDQERVLYWKNYLKDDHNFKIGICWQPDVKNDVSRLPIARRGIPLSLFYSLAKTAGISIYSLQRGTGKEQLENLPNNIKIHAFDDQFDVTHGSFVDSAAVMQHMDLIISTDTALAHLAGAMGLRTWLLLPYATDWRWLQDRTDSPWYPTMRIFKQQIPFQWDKVIKQLENILFNEVLRE